jgi:hypothetical protein
VLVREILVKAIPATEIPAKEIPVKGIRVRDEVAIAQFEARSSRRAERRRGFGLLFFGRFARAD